MRIILILLVLLSMDLSAQTRETEIDRMMRFGGANGYFNGSIAVIEKGEVVYCQSFGYSNFETKRKNDNHSIYELASVTKQFTAMTIMMLKERGKLSYNDSLRKYFPELPYKGITIRQMLNHTSGMPDYIREIGFQSWDPEKIYSNRDAVLELIKYNLPIHFKPGEKFEYCNTGYMLLALIVEKVSGVSFEQFLLTNIFKPLGMTDSGLFTRYANMKAGDRRNMAHGFMFDIRTSHFDLPENISQTRIVRSFGGLYGDGLIGSSISDMIKWELSLNTERLLKKTTMDDALTPGVLNNGQSCGYGFGWFLQNDATDGKIAQHTGGWSGVRNAVVRWLEKDRILIVLRNTDVDFLGIQDAVKNILNGKPYTMPRPSMAQALSMVSSANDSTMVRKQFEELKNNQANIKEDDINILGYALMEARKLNSCIAIFKINTELFPNSSNAFDSLGEACLKAGKKDLAKKFYTKSLQLDPKNEGAKKALESIG